MLWGIGEYYWYLLALVLVLLCFCWEAYFLHEVISPSKMFCNFGGGYFLTVLVLFWLQVTGFKWTSAKGRSYSFFGCVRGDAKGSRARSADGLPVKHPGTRCSQVSLELSGVCSSCASVSLSADWLSPRFHSWSREASLPPPPELYIL